MLIWLPRLPRTALVAAAFAALTVAVVQARRRNAQDRDELATLRDSVDALRALVADSRRVGALARSAALEAQVRPEPGAADAADALERPAERTADEGAANAEPGATAPPEEGAPRTAEEARQQLETQFAAEPIDAVWAGETSRAVQHTLSTILPTGAGIRSLSCHSAHCRLELALRDAASLDSFQREALYGSNLLWRGPMRLDPEVRPDGTVALVTYLMRE